MAEPPAFIETQFPIARLSAESYKERKATNSQTLTGLGRWWGRKPLVLVRAAIVGMLMPVSDDPKRDREVFLRIMTMDDDGTWARCKPPLQRKLGRTAFDALPYAGRIVHCERPENVAGPSAESWATINDHLGTNASSLSELVDELGRRAFGHRPRVGDSFCGGGSIPFEAARMGCNAFGSDLSPVAGLLSWSSINLLGAGADVQQRVRSQQAAVFAAAKKQIAEWGIETNARGEQAEAYLYCVEVKPEGSPYFIPLSPTWLVGESTKAIVCWQRRAGSEQLWPVVITGSDDEVSRHKAKYGATVVDSRVVDPFDPARTWSVEALRGSEGLRRWVNDDVAPQPGDVFQERLYCIRWVDPKGTRRYAAPDDDDLAREARVVELLSERFADWQRKGFIPSRTIPVRGAETDRLFRERGWTHWHHLFTPRQLLVNGLVVKMASSLSGSLELQASSLLGIARLANWNARLCRWRGCPKFCV